MTNILNFKTTLLTALLSTSLMSCARKAQISLSPPSLSVVWQIDGFDSPECVQVSQDKSFLYVTNINGKGGNKDGNGYISKLSMDGKIISKKWATGLDAPKGMALNGNILYVTDIDKLVEIDAVTGAILKSTPAPNAKFLNDVAYVAGLGVLASDSSAQSIYLYDGNTMSVWLEDEILDRINGLHVDEERVLVTTMAKGELLSLNPKTKSLDVIANGMKNADGIKILKDGSYFTSSWPGQLYHVSKAGVTTLLQDTSEEGRMMNDFDLQGDTVYMANLRPGSVQAIKLNH